MTQAAVQTNIRVNGQDEPLGVPTLAALLEEKTVDTGQRGIAVALNGAIVPRRCLAADGASPRRQHRDRARPSGWLRSYSKCPIP